MNTSVIVIGLLVGTANYLFRYFPLRFTRARSNENPTGRWAALILDGIGIASICSLLVVSSVPVVLQENNKLLPTLAGFAVLALSFYKTRSIVISTLAGAVGFGLVYKIFITTIFT